MVNQHRPVYQKQAPVGTPPKIPFENKQQIHRRTPTPKFVCNKVARVPHWLHTFRDTLTRTTKGPASFLCEHFNHKKINFVVAVFLHNFSIIIPNTKRNFVKLSDILISFFFNFCWLVNTLWRTWQISPWLALALFWPNQIFELCVIYQYPLQRSLYLGVRVLWKSLHYQYFLSCFMVNYVPIHSFVWSIVLVYQFLALGWLFYWLHRFDYFLINILFFCFFFRMPFHLRKF